MSFLTPLYLFGALAVGLPILFHLIRRTPRGRQLFSSVMFLAPSPPRITRRSRIEHWLLLCLRGLAICLLAAAFARPFLREQTAADAAEGNGRWVAVLVDTSASMRRGNLWDEAREQVRGALRGAGPHDRVALYTFDDQLQERFSWDAWRALDPAQRAEASEATIRDATPSWRGTNLGQALVTVADSLEDAGGAEREPGPREVVVVSDLASGCRLEALQSFEWPEGVRVTFERVGAERPPTNAGLHVPMETDTSDGALRVRVTNAADSEHEQFRLSWQDEFTRQSSVRRGSPDPAVRVDRRFQDDEGRPAVGAVDGSGDPSTTGAGDPSTTQPTATASVEVYVPPGQSRVIRAPELPAEYVPTRLVLVGDAHEFDNTCYVSQRRTRDVAIVYLGSDDRSDTTQYRYFVEPLFPSTRERNVRVIDWEFESTELPESTTGLQMVVLTEPPRPDQTGVLRAYAQSGGLIVFVPRNSDDCAVIYELAGVAPQPATEAEIDSYAMVGEVDFSHPMFAPLADPRFSDFTKLHFWKHRRIDTAALPECRVLARFDDGDALIGEVPLGRGRLVFFTSGWNRGDSQLAVWSKFVPLMNGLLEYGSGQVQRQAQFLVGDDVPLAALGGPRDVFESVRSPDGTTQTLPEGTMSFTQTDQPGIYRLSGTSNGAPHEVRFAVNVTPAESRTDPLPLETLEAAGIGLAVGDSAAAQQAAAERERQLQNQELEGRQKLWRWLIVAAVLLLVAETLLGGRLARQRSEPAT